MLICVTDRNLCKDDFLMRIDQIAKAKPHAILLREKDLSIANYQRLARSVREICLNNQVPLIIHQNIEVATALKCPAIHLSMQDFKQYKHELKLFSQRGVSVHSVSEAKEAQQLGATYLIAGHIFSTECKKGVPPRGLPFLQEVCDSVTIPVFAIGGITKDKVKEVIGAGAKGICVMSEAMTCCQPVELTNSFSV
ncbi:thiamine phosphate synthase [Desulforamulus aeronauticus]|uniref:Thiamine-phosphate pyrophosphorylase n=1 Tax=Desulforamulus aeronauticus DSM 10349 TaxID=1121421 RepID=A0A1M6QCL5_9FIRM|nr:thiamine phosphate synthase [Desulforamulus aeronauticus]SHK18029.1 thiamine-phosphate pyrophosphorylase [Desulforamulus aeronauticus DSM 10349]